MFSKGMCIKVNVLYTNGVVTTTQYDSNKQDLEGKIEDVDTKYLILVDLTKKLIITQKLQKLKTRFLMLLN